MADTKNHMVSNPIKEIIFNVSFANDIKQDCLNDFVLLPKIKKIFPIIKSGYHANVKATNDGEAPVTEIKKSGYILKCDDPKNRLLQAKIGLFAYHKTKEYENYEVLANEIDVYWKEFQKCTGSLKVTNVSLRYLNFIEIREDEDIFDLITITTQHPFGAIINNLIQLKFVAIENKDVFVNVIVAKGKDGDKSGAILDIILNKKIENTTFEDISLAFQGMRDIKNNVFQMSITEETKKKYKL
jgi:uncharacterized protein (TIGR04255 family)